MVLSDVMNVPRNGSWCYMILIYKVMSFFFHKLTITAQDICNVNKIMLQNTVLLCPLSP